MQLTKFWTFNNQRRIGQRNIVFSSVKCVNVRVFCSLCRVSALSSAGACVQEGPRLQEEYNPGNREQSQVIGTLATGLYQHKTSSNIHLGIIIYYS